MMKMMREFVRSAAVAAVILAGSCASPPSSGPGQSADPALNHPISVEPHMTSIKVNFSAPEAGLLPDDSAHFEAFVAEFLSRGTGSISVSAPQGADAAAVIGYFGNRLFQMGVPRARILVGSHDTSDPRVELSYIAYSARTDPCGDWSDNLALTYDNTVSRNFGCAVQNNIAAQMADPRDIIEMRPTDPADAARRGTVLDNYEHGRVTAAEKTKSQSGAVSEVNNTSN
jgi:pilus assembly protein CpaD